MENYRFQIDLETEPKLKFKIKNSSGITIEKGLGEKSGGEYGFIDPSTGDCIKLSIRKEEVLAEGSKGEEIPLLLFIDGILIL